MEFIEIRQLLGRLLGQFVQAALLKVQRLRQLIGIYPIMCGNIDNTHVYVPMYWFIRELAHLPTGQAAP